MRCSETISVKSVPFSKWSCMVIALTRLFLCVLCVKLISGVTLSDHILAWLMNWWSISTSHSSHQPALTDPCKRHSSASARLRLLLSLPCPHTAGSNASLHKHVLHITRSPCRILALHMAARNGFFRALQASFPRENSWSLFVLSDTQTKGNPRQTWVSSKPP